jgi:hypothetical protein
VAEAAARTRPRGAQAQGVQRRLAPWLATLAITLNLLAPGLCLAQMLVAGSLGEICSATASPGDGQDLRRPGDALSLHGLQHCGHCAAPGVSMVDTASPSHRLLLRAVLPQPEVTPAPEAAPSSWRPPSRGPPLSA